MKPEDRLGLFWGSVIVFFVAALTIQTCRPTKLQAQTLTVTKTPTPIPTGKLLIYKYDLKTEEGLAFWHYLSSSGKLLHEGMTVQPRKEGETDTMLRTRLEGLAKAFVQANKVEWNLVKPVPTKVLAQ